MFQSQKRNENYNMWLTRSLKNTAVTCTNSGQTSEKASFLVDSLLEIEVILQLAC
jgi:hypothetical protein